MEITGSSFVLRRRVFKLFGGEFRIFDATGNLIVFADQKAFKLKEDIRLYADEAKTRELLVIKARKVLDMSANYDITDPAGGVVGVLRRKGLRSVVRDEWLVLDPQETQIATIVEESMFAALLRRFVAGALLPQTFVATVGDRVVARFHQHFNPFVQKIDLDFTADTAGALDRRLGIAAAVLLCAIEQRQR